MSLSTALTRLLRRLLFSSCCLLLALGAAHAQQETKTFKGSTLTLVADTTAIEAGKPFTAGVRFELDADWDTYWQYPGDPGQPTRITWELPPGFTAGPLQWPLPESHISFGEFLNYVYFHEVLLFAQITPPAQLPAGPVIIKAKVECQMCDPHTCVPRNADLALSMNPGAAQPANAELFAKWRAQVPKTSTPPFSVKWDRSKATEFALRVEGLPKEFKAEFFPLPPEGVIPGSPTASDVGDDGSRTITFPIKTGGKPGLPWRGVIATAKDDAPREGWVIDSATAASAGSFTSTSQATAPVYTGARLLTLLWSAFLGGLILNLMPCVLPVIALKIFGFVQQAGEHPRRVFHLGLAFVAGVFAFFLGLATLVAVLRAYGIGLNWGFQFQHPAIFIGLIVLVFLFGLNLLGVFEISLSGGTASKLSELSSREGFSGAFTHGLFTTLLGTSCTAPLLGPVLGAAFAAPPHVIYLIFTAIATGMSLPYFLLTAKPAWLRFLPKPGVWMNQLKQFMGFIMLGVVVWLLGVFGKTAGIDSLISLSAFLLVLGVVCWIYGSFTNRRLAWIFIIVLFAASFLVYRNGGETSGIVWQPWSEERVAEATKKGQPVFVDFTAEWCLNCKANEKLVLNSEPVRAAFAKKKVLTLKADWTNYDPKITAVLQKYGRAGVPAYLLYPGGNAEPILLPELLTRNTVLDELKRLKD